MFEVEEIKLPLPQWVKNESKKEWFFEDGQTFIIAIPVKNNKTGKEYWELDKIRWDCDGENAYMRIADSDESYDAWDWSDVEYYIEVQPD